MRVGSDVRPRPHGLAFINPLTLSASDFCTPRAYIRACIINRNAFEAIGEYLRSRGFSDQRTDSRAEYFRTDAH